MVGRRQPTRACTDNQHSLAAGRPRRIEQPPSLSRQVARYRSTECIETALSRLAPLQTLSHGGSTPPVDRGKRIVGHERKPGQLVLVPLHAGKPRLDVLARRQPPFARRWQIDIHQALLADLPYARAPVPQIRQRRDIRRRAVISPAPRSEARTADSCGRFTKQSHLAGWDGVALSCNSPHLPPIGRLSALCCLRRYLADLLCAPPDPVFVRLRRTGADYKLENLRTGVPSSRRSELSRQIRT